MPAWIYLVILGACALLGYAVFQIMAAMQDGERETLRKRLAALDVKRGETPGNYLREGRHTGKPWLKLILFRQGWIDQLWRWLRQSNLGISLETFVIVSIVFALVGWLLPKVLGWGVIQQVAIAGAMLLAPTGWVRFKINKRRERFDEQLPEALDLIGRSLKAGHTFTSGMNMVSREFTDPLREEFRLTIEEINFGGHLNDALDNLSERVPSADLMFFVASVKIQSETGGKLTEIMDSISYLIRERAKLKGKVAAISAEGRLSGLVMFLLPPAMLGILNLMNPKYMAVLFETSTGNNILYVAGAMLVMGILVIRKMATIRV